jgi:predicted DNA-binding transcriptional regulator AlpA
MTTMLTRDQVARRYGKHARTIDRWSIDPAMGFPKPLMIGKSPLWSEAELEEFERTLPRRQLLERTTGEK